MLTHKFKFLLATILMSANAYAQSELLNNPLRPRISEVLDYHEGYQPEQRVPLSGDRLNYGHFRNAIMDGAPQFIAKLEKAYPGATYAFMGRDTQVISDVVEAFYLSIGQQNRVVQIGASKTTFQGLSDQDTVEYLKYFGLDLDKVDESKPFILVDTISSGEVIDGVLISGRQGRHLLQVLYQEWINRGRNPVDLLNKVNMVGMQVSTFKTGEIGNTERYMDVTRIGNIEEINRANAFKFFRQQTTSRMGLDFVLPLIPDTQMVFNESGYDHYTGAWHDRFQPPLRTEEGMVPNPGPLTHELYRKSILWLQHQVIDIVGDVNFHRRVEQEVIRSNVGHFPVTRTDYRMYSCKKLLL
jgi:hypothetical protein